MPHHNHPSEQILHTVERATLLKQLQESLPEGTVVYEAEDMRPYECDALSSHCEMPWVVVLPTTVTQVQTILKICYAEGIPVVARGAGTGISGGARPVSNGVLLNLSRFTRIIEIDIHNRTARVEPGVRNIAISQAAAPYHLYYAPDPSSQVACTIGGNIAENSGGVHCLKYGLTVHNVLEIQFVRMDGERVTVGSRGLDGPGYDFLALMCGSEGLLGIIVEVLVRLLPIPPIAHALLASFDSIEEAGSAVAAVIGEGLIPAGLEMMDNHTIRATEMFVQAGYPTESAAIVLCELDGLPEQVSTDLDKAERVLWKNGANMVRRSQSESERHTFWAGRKAAFPAIGRIAADYYCMDGTIPRRHLAEVLKGISALSKEYCLPVANVFHAGDGNLHPLILFDANQPGELEQAETLGQKILELCIQAGGTITGEHGVGVEKINAMCVQFGSGELAQFHAVKIALDPKRLLNPGKAIPSLHRCADFGALHVSGGRLPYPELERF